MQQFKPIHRAIRATVTEPYALNSEHWVAFLAIPMGTRFIDAIIQAEETDYRIMRALARRPNRRAIHAHYSIANWPHPAPDEARQDRTRRAHLVAATVSQETAPANLVAFPVDRCRT